MWREANQMLESRGQCTRVGISVYLLFKYVLSASVSTEATPAANVLLPLFMHLNFKTDPLGLYSDFLRH